MSNLQAYKVTETEEDLYVIEFASSAQSALKQGAWELNSDWEYCTVDRAPEWDEYAELGYVPPAVLIEVAGCKYECWHCSKEVYWDCGFTYDDEDYEPQECEPVFDRKAVFCCAQCQENWKAEKARSKARVDGAIEYLSSKFPGITNIKAFGGSDDYPVYASFNAPGCLGKIDWRSDDTLHVGVQRRDVEAWRSFRDSIAPVREDSHA